LLSSAPALKGNICTEFPLMPSRKKPVLSKAALLQIPDVEEKIKARLDELLSAMLDLALGHYKQISKYDKEAGEVQTKIYTTDPDFKALAFLIENVIGKVPQRLEMTGDGGGPIRVIPWMTTAEATRMGLIENKMLEAGDVIEAEVRELVPQA